MDFNQSHDFLHDLVDGYKSDNNNNNSDGNAHTSNNTTVDPKEGLHVPNDDVFLLQPQQNIPTTTTTTTTTKTTTTTTTTNTGESSHFLTGEMLLGGFTSPSNTVESPFGYSTKFNSMNDMKSSIGTRGEEGGAGVGGVSPNNTDFDNESYLNTLLKMRDEFSARGFQQETPEIKVEDYSRSQPSKQGSIPTTAAATRTESFNTHGMDSLLHETFPTHLKTSWLDDQDLYLSPNTQIPQNVDENINTLATTGTTNPSFINQYLSNNRDDLETLDSIADNSSAFDTDSQISSSIYSLSSNSFATPSVVSGFHPRGLSSSGLQRHRRISVGEQSVASSAAGTGAGIGGGASRLYDTKSISGMSAKSMASRASKDDDFRLHRKRSCHNEVERRRRDLIKYKIKELNTIVPDTIFSQHMKNKTIKPKKRTVLCGAIDYLKVLTNILKVQKINKNGILQKIQEYESFFKQKKHLSANNRDSHNIRKDSREGEEQEQEQREKNNESNFPSLDIYSTESFDYIKTENDLNTLLMLSEEQQLPHHNSTVTKDNSSSAHIYKNSNDDGGEFNPDAPTLKDEKLIINDEDLKEFLSGA